MGWLCPNVGGRLATRAVSCSSAWGGPAGVGRCPGGPANRGRSRGAPRLHCWRQHAELPQTARQASSSSNPNPPAQHSLHLPEHPSTRSLCLSWGLKRLRPRHARPTQPAQPAQPDQRHPGVCSAEAAAARGARLPAAAAGRRFSRCCRRSYALPTRRLQLPPSSSCLLQAAEPLAAARRAFSVATNGGTDGTIERGADGHILPHGGGALVNLMAGSAAAEEMRARCNYQLEITDRQVGAGELARVRAGRRTQLGSRSLGGCCSGWAAGGAPGTGPARQRQMPAAATAVRAAWQPSGFQRLASPLALRPAGL